MGAAAWSPLDGTGGPRRWIATWGTALSTQELDAIPGVFPAPDTPTLADRTLRQVARVSVGGDVARVRLSNGFGGGPALVGAARVALRASGARTVPGTDRALTFGGRGSVTIAPGAEVVSDPVALGLAALAELAVSIYLPHATPATTVHSSGRAPSYLLAGDRTAVADPEVSATLWSLYFLAGVEVLASPDVGLVVCLGDSLTDGVGATLDAPRAWPDLLSARLAARAGGTFAVVNQGYAGNRLLHDHSAASALARFDRDVLGQRGATDVILFEGINDLGMPASGLRGESVTAEDLVAAYRRLIARAHDAALRIHGATLTPFGGSSAFTAEGEAKRLRVNEFVRHGGAFDGVLDLDAAVRDAARPTRLLPRYDAGDHLHLSDAGHEALARAIDPPCWT